MANDALRSLIDIGPESVDGLSDLELRRVMQRSAWVHGMARQRLEQRNVVFSEEGGHVDGSVLTFVGTVRRRRASNGGRS
ncbi:MAG TPA: hypothetical protein VIP51_06810 [Eoetvoesiella sp.]